MKNRIRADHPMVAREYGFKLVPNVRTELERRLSRFPTPVRPGSGSKGYLVLRLSVWQRQTPLAMTAPLTKQRGQVKFIDRDH